MLTLATVAQKNNSLSGRFEGFAAPEVSNMTEEGIQWLVFYIPTITDFDLSDLFSLGGTK